MRGAIVGGKTDIILDRLMDFMDWCFDRMSWKKLIIGFIVFIVALIALDGYLSLRTADHIVTVCSKERVVDGDSSAYRVYTNDGKKSRTFVVTDAHWIGIFWRTNSADVYAGIRDNVTYEVHTRGTRWSLFSWFENIESMKRLDEGDQHAEWCK